MISEQDNNNRNNDKWLQWISLREEEIENSDKDDSEKGDYRKMFKELRDYRNKLLDKKEKDNKGVMDMDRTNYDDEMDRIKYDNERGRTRKELDDRFDEVTKYIRKHYKKDEANVRIAERTHAYEAAKKNINDYEEWLQQNSSRTEARAWADQHSRRQYYGFKAKEPEVYFRQQQETQHDYERRLARNEGIAIISELIPRIGERNGEEDLSYVQTTDEYFAYLSKIYDQFPRVVGENDEKYKQRIETAFQNGDLQLAAARVLIDPWSEVDQEIEKGLALTETVEKILAGDRDIEPEQRKNLEESLIQHKKTIFEYAVKVEEKQRNEREKEAREVHREELKFQRDMRMIEKEKAARRRERFRRLGRLASIFTRNRK